MKLRQIKKWTRSTSKFSKKVSDNKLNNGRTLALILVNIIMLLLIVFLFLSDSLGNVPSVLQAAIFGVIGILVIFLSFIMFVS